MRTVVALLLLSGCLVELDYVGSSFTCLDDVCPTGFDCRAGMCIESGAALDAGVDGPPSDAPSPDGSIARCPTECPVISGTDLCYCDEPLEWASARDACVAKGFVLARIDDDAAASALRLMLANIGADAYAWLGGTDSVLEGEWRWLKNDDVFWVGLADGAAPLGTYVNWNVDEPNQYMGNEEDCLQAWPEGWNDARCEMVRPYVCSEP